MLLVFVYIRLARTYLTRVDWLNKSAKTTQGTRIDLLCLLKLITVPGVGNSILWALFCEQYSVWLLRVFCLPCTRVNIFYNSAFNDTIFRPPRHQSVIVLDPTIIFLIYTIRNKEQVCYGIYIILQLGHVNWKNVFFVPENVNTNIDVSLKLVYYISIGREWKFDTAPVKHRLLLPQYPRYSFRISHSI